MIFRAGIAAIAVMLAGVAGAQEGDPKLADLRAQLQELTQQVQSLRSELVASGAEGFAAAGGDTAIDRMNAMEAQLSTLTGQTERLQHRIRRIVKDGTQRIADLEFQMCQLDETCDLAALMTPPDLGSVSDGVVIQPIAPPPDEPSEPDSQPSATEQHDFDHAKEVLATGDFRRAADLFAEVAQTHAGGPLTAEAQFLRGSALDSASLPDQAAAAWLEAFAADPDGARAPESLLGIARIFADKGDATGACIYLAEIPVRFADNAAVGEAEQRMQTLDCGTAEQPGPDGAGLDPEADADLFMHE